MVHVDHHLFKEQPSNKKEITRTKKGALNENSFLLVKIIVQYLRGDHLALYPCLEDGNNGLRRSEEK